MKRDGILKRIGRFHLLHELCRGAQGGGITLGEKELALLRTLRNQGVMAFKQAS